MSVEPRGRCYPRRYLTQGAENSRGRALVREIALCHNVFVAISVPATVSRPSLPASVRSSTSARTIAGALAIGLVLSLISPTHGIFAIIGLPAMAFLAFASPRTAIIVLPVWMTLLGFFRRFTPGGGNTTLSGDPMLLIGPITIIILWLMSNQKGLPTPKTTLSRVVFAFNVVALLEAANPAQGSLMAGVAGLLFIFVPTLAFWIGRRFVDEDLLWRIAWSVAILSLMAALYGLYQQFVKFPTWDLVWIDSKGYTALNLGSGIVRAFSFFSSAQEYAVFLSIGVVAWTALATRRVRWPMPLHLAALATVATALFYESQRTSVFITALALGVIVSARRRMRPVTVGIAGLSAVVLLIAFAGAIGGGGGGSAALQGEQSASSVLVSHQLDGITDPTGSGSSLPGHIKATRVGINQGFKHPLGHGSSSVNLASSRYTAKDVKGTEFDPGNMGIAFGIFGLIIYVLLLFRMTGTGYKLAVTRRDPLGIFVLGVVMATLLQWTNGNLYSVCWLLWLVVGAGDGITARGGLTQPVAAAPAAPEVFTWRRPGEPRRVSVAR